MLRVKVLIPCTSNVALIENVPFANVIKVFLKVVGGGGCPYSNWLPDRKSKRENGLRVHPGAPTSRGLPRIAKDHQGLPVAIRSRGVAWDKRSLPVCTGSNPSRHLDFKLPTSSTPLELWENRSRRLRDTSLWYFAPASLGHEHTAICNECDACLPHPAPGCELLKNGNCYSP